MRFESSLDRRLFELVVLVVAARARADYEWAAHSVLGRKAGLDAEVIEAIGRETTPQFAREAEAAVHAFAVALVRDLRVGKTAYDRAIALVGQQAVLEVVSVVGYYLALAVSLNAFEVEPPGGSHIPWRDGTSGE